ncbi:MAG: hypothetical protein ACI4CT_07695 [Lachnospiraceae bacterium]
MNIINRLERKFGKYAIKDLPKYIIILYIIGAVFQIFAPNAYGYFLALNPERVLRGEVWRLITFVMQPPTTSIFFLIFVLLFYYSICQTLVRIWGDFKFNLYIFTGVLGNIIAAFLMYVITKNPYIYMDTYYINLSLFLAFAMILPEQVVLLYGLIPIKIKWLAYLDIALLAYSFIHALVSHDIGTCIGVVVAMLNFFLYSFAEHSPGAKLKNKKRQYEFQKKVNNVHKKTEQAQQSSGRGQSYQDHQTQASNGQPRHRCAVCGRTELDNPNLEFRYCSKCNGNYEYCQDHLFTHEHRK